MIYAILLLFMFIAFGFTMILANGKIINEYQKIYLSLFFVICILIIGLRANSVGYDTVNYVSIFYLVDQTSWGDIVSSFYFLSIESGYVLLMKLCQTVYDNYYFFQLVVAILYCYEMKNFLRNNTRYYFLSSILFLGLGLFLPVFNITRQMLSVAFCVNAWTYLTQKKVKLYIFFMMIAISFHISAVLFLIASLLYYVRKRKIVLRVIPFVIAGLCLNLNYLIDITSNYLIKYGTYYANIKELEHAGGVYALWALIVLFSFLILYLKNKTITDYSRIYAIFSLVYVATGLLGLKFNYAERLGLYFLPFVIILFEDVGKKIPVISLRWGYWVGVFVCFIIYFLMSTTSNQYSYEFFFL